MKDINGIPCYKASVDTEDTGMWVISMVSMPAIEESFLTFAKETTIQLSIQDEDQHMVYGPVMIPNKPIYRVSPEGFEYYIIFDSPTIHKMAEKFFFQSRQNDVDVQHSFILEEGVNLVQAFYKNADKGIDPVEYKDLPDDTLFFQYHITNDEIWERVKKGELTGFSLAGNFALEPDMEFSKQKPNELDEIENLLQEINNKLRK